MADRPAPEPTCRCGHTRDDGMVVAEPKYTVAGMAALLFGISAEPIRIEYRCRRCGDVVAVTTDPAVLKTHT